MKYRYLFYCSAFLCLITFLNTSTLFAQDEIIQYIKKGGAYTDNEKEAIYTRKLGTRPNDVGLYTLEEHYPNGNLKRKGLVRYEDPSRFSLEGWVETYFKAGGIHTRIHYQQNKRIDTASSYFSDGTLREQKIYTKIPKGVRNTDKYIQQWYLADSAGNVQVKEGNGTGEIVDGNVRSKGAFVNGYKQGRWEGSFQKGKYTFEEWYYQGEVTRGVTTDASGKTYKYTQVRVSPKYPGGIRALMQYIGENYTYPKEALKNGISGTAILKFVIDREGNPVEFKVLKDLGYGTGEEGIEVVRRAGKWSTALSRGIPVRVSYTLPLVLNTGG